MYDKLPAVMTDAPSPAVSNQYVFLDTKEIINTLKEQAWNVVDARQVKPKRRDQNFVKHMLRFRQERPVELHGTVPEIVVTNSHDTYAGFRMFAGLYRFVCLNGMVIGQDVFEMKAKHIGGVKELISTSLAHLTKEVFPTLEDRIKAWLAIQLNEAQRIQYAVRALELKASGSTSVPAHLLGIRRFEDKAMDLWTTYNVVQENIMKGGIQSYSILSGNTVTSRPIKAIDSTVRLNRALWELTERTAKEIVSAPQLAKMS